MSPDLEPSCWWIGPGPLVWYAFLGGAAAGALLLTSFVRLFGSKDDRRSIRPAGGLTILLLAVSAGLLAYEDLRPGGVAIPKGVPVEFLRLSLLVSVTGFALRDLPRLDTLFAAVGLIAALGLGLSEPPATATEWSSPFWLAAVRLASAASTGFAAVALVAPRDEEGDGLATPIAGAVVAELAGLTGLALSLTGPAGFALQRWPGRLIPLFVVPFGLVLPLVMRQVRGPRGAADAAWLVVLGGLALQTAIAGIPASLTLR